MSLIASSTARALRISVLACAAFAASCTGGGVVYETQTVAVRPAPPPRPERACTREYAPVCGQQRGEQRTFGNACTADAAGYRVAYNGECRGGPPPLGARPGVRPDLTSGPSRPQQSERACTRQYQPVCARRGSQVRTFGNSCEADNAGFQIVDRGPC